MNYVEDNLCCDYGYLQNYPSYCTKDPKIGRLTYFDNGIFENGSVYNHGVAFKAVADCMIGDGNRAIETIRKILPTNPKNPSDKSGVEPYVMSNMYFGPENPTRPGAAPQSWITGTSGWLFRCLVENIVGIQADFDGLKIEPKIPDDWHNITAKRKFRNAIYDITIISENKDSEFKLTVDGKEIDGNIVPIFDTGVHTVTVKR